MTLTIQTKFVLQAVDQHPDCMSPVLLEHLLRGEVIGRMAEKGLLESPLLAALSDLPPGAVAHLVEACLDAGWLSRSGGFYPALSLTLSGRQLLNSFSAQVHSTELSPDDCYQAYYRWRQSLARERRTPPYRILTNQTLNHLARIRPTSLDELLLVPGLGKRRALRYRDELMSVGQALKNAQLADA